MKQAWKGLALATALGFAGASQAALVNMNGTTVDVGGVDTLINASGSLGGCGPGSSPAAETCWANSVLGASGTATLFDKDEPVSYFATDVANTYAFMLPGDPGYFIIKNSTYWALYQNQPNKSWGVFSTVGLPEGMNLGGSGNLTISHVTSFNGTAIVPNPNAVPEPGTLALIGMGLLGIGAGRLRRKA